MSKTDWGWASGGANCFLCTLFIFYFLLEQTDLAVWALQTKATGICCRSLSPALAFLITQPGLTEPHGAPEWSNAGGTKTGRLFGGGRRPLNPAANAALVITACWRAGEWWHSKRNETTAAAEVMLHRPCEKRVFVVLRASLWHQKIHIVAWMIHNYSVWVQKNKNK